MFYLQVMGDMEKFDKHLTHNFQRKVRELIFEEEFVAGRQVSSEIKSWAPSMFPAFGSSTTSSIIQR